MFLITAAAVVVVQAVHTTTLLDRLYSLGQVAAALGAIGVVGTFLWTRLRLDRAWKWLFRHIKEDQKKARLVEFYEAQADPQVRELRIREVKETITPELRDLHDCLDRIGVKVVEISDKQKVIAAELTETRDHVESVATKLVTSNDQITELADIQRRELERVARDRPIWVEDRRQLQEYMAKGSKFIDEKSDADPSAV